MQMIRTTISLPVDIHEEWRLEAVRRRMALGDVILEKSGAKKRKNTKMDIDKQIEKDFAFFDKIAAGSVEYDAVRAVREERDRDEN